MLTVLIHLGYLSYDKSKGECYIPNKEVRIEMTNAVEDTGWKCLTDALAALTPHIQEKNVERFFSLASTTTEKQKLTLAR